MKLNDLQIKSIAFGYEQLNTKDGFYSFNRFTESEILLYEKYKTKDLLLKTYSSAGVRFSFITDSENFSITYKFSSASSRLFAFFDVYENDVLIDHFGKEQLDDEIETKTIKFSKGKKHIEIYFPWSAVSEFKDVVLDDNCTIIPKKREKTILCYGDSITHGYDAIYPSLSYSSQIAKKLNADIVNKAIGGEVYFPELASAKNDTPYDYITIAYGTNDWNKCSLEVFENSCKEFIKAVANGNKNSKIFVITPIWRADNDRLPVIGVPFFDMHDLISSLAKGYHNVKVINGVNLAPHFEDFYSDKYLHPNDLGFNFYAKNLYDEIIKG